MSAFSLVILTPREAVFEGEVTSVVMPTTDGEIGFLAGREDSIFALLPGDLRLRTEEGESIYETDGGVIEMTGRTMTVLCGTAYPKEEAAFLKSRRASELSEEKKRQEQSLADYKITRAALVRAFEKLRHSKTK